MPAIDEPDSNLPRAASPDGPAVLPDSGDGLRPPAPADLPRPALWAEPRPGAAPAAFRGSAERDADIPERTRGRWALIWSAVAAIAVGAAILGLSLVEGSLPLAVTGLVAVVVGGAVAVRAGILTTVSIGQSPVGRG